jgi:hypothetical protein
MNLILELLTQILADVGISSSQEEEILTRIKDSNTPLETIENPTSEDSYASDDEQLIEKEIEEDEEELQHDLSEKQCTYEILIEQWFQVSTRLNKFCFCFYSVKSQSHQFDSFIFVHFYFSCIKMKMNIVLLLLREWLHWKFNYT